MKHAKGGFLTIALFALAATLLVFSAVGSSQAALNYFSDTYGATVSMQDIGVTLVENGPENKISWRDYDSEKDYTLEENNWDQNTGSLLSGLLADGEELTLGKRYSEQLAVTNSGNIDEYVRVSIYKYWADASGEKTRDTAALDPSLIRLDIPEGNGWIKESETDERTVLFYNGILGPGETSSNFLEGLTLDAMGIEQQIDRVNVTHNGGQTVFETTYTYNGLQFVLRADVDAVQTHHADDAMRSAWGVSYLG